MAGNPMTKREKIILGFCGAAVIGAGVFYAVDISEQPSADLGANHPDFSSLVLKAKASLSEGELTMREERVLALATSQWVRNPLRSRPLMPHGDESEPMDLLPSYIGFINTGPQPIAIIDGRDYRVGEWITGGEFEVVQVKADHIRLLRRGAIDAVKVPIEKPRVP